MLFNGNNLFTDQPQQNNNMIKEKKDPKLEPIPLPTHGITPRPLLSSELHKDNNNKQTTSSADDTTSTITKNLINDSDDLLPALRKLQRMIKPTTRLQESTEYMSRSMVNHIKDNN